MNSSQAQYPLIDDLNSIEKGAYLLAVTAPMGYVASLTFECPCDFESCANETINTIRTLSSYDEKVKKVVELDNSELLRIIDHHFFKCSKKQELEKRV